MKIGDKFIAEKFEGIHGCSFVYSMNNYIGNQCEVVELRDYKAYVRFENGEMWEWLNSALKPIKGFYVGQKVYSHLFPTNDCSGVVSKIYNNNNVYDVEIFVNSKKFLFSKDGRYSESSGICLFSEPIERPEPKINFEYGELVWASDGDDLWTLVFFNKNDSGGYGCFTHKDSNGNLREESVYSYIKKYE